MKIKNIILFIVCLLFGLLFINSGANKLFHYLPMPEDAPEGLEKVNNAFMTIGWLMPLVGIVEIIGGILVIIPKTRALGAMMLLPIIIGILLTHVYNVPSGLPMALVLLVIDIWILVDNRAKFRTII